MCADQVAPVPAEDIQKILAAAPSKAPAKPKRPRKLLVVTSAPMYYHDVIPWGTEALRILGEKTGAYTMTLDNDPSAFQKANLAAYDAVCFNNTCGHLFEDAALRGNLIEYVMGGKGFAGIHCAAHTFVGWEPYGLLNGAFSISHPWVSETVTVKIEEPSHPVVSMLGESFALVDEIYEFAPQPYSRKRLRVLASIDTSKTDMTKSEIKRTDGDFGLAWVQNFGKGRSFFTAFGHYKELCWNTQILEHYLAGIQFALGDLEAPASPR